MDKVCINIWPEKNGFAGIDRKVKKDEFWTKKVLNKVCTRILEKKMCFGQSVYQNAVKKDGFWMKCVLEISKKNVGF